MAISNGFLPLKQLPLEPERYPFQELLLWLEKQGVALAATDAPVRLIPAPEVSFPGADIKRARFNRKHQLELELTFMGLYGVDSPLPPFFAALLLAETPGAERLRRFTALINHSIYSLYYLAWKKYQPHIGLHANRYLSYLRALSAGTLQSDDISEYTYAGLLGMRARNAVGLQSMLQDFLQGWLVSVKSFAPQWRSAKTLPLGGLTSHEIGNNILLGSAVLDVGHKINIVIGPLPQSEALQLLPRTALAQRLKKLVQRYLPLHITYHLQVLIQHINEPLKLGHENLCLGYLVNSL